jgi:hypothetical protein
MSDDTISISPEQATTLFAPFSAEMLKLGSRVGDVEADISGLKSLVGSQGVILKRIENKLDSPDSGPSWVAIAGLLASLTGIVGGCILGFIILKTGPILTDVAENDIAVSDLEKRVDTLDTRLSVAEATILINTERNDTQFVMLAKRRSSVIEELRRENTALKEAIVENARGLR